MPAVVEYESEISKKGSPRAALIIWALTSIAGWAVVVLIGWMLF